MLNAQNRFFELSHDLLCITDGDGTYLAANDSWRRILGWSPLELTDQSYVEYLHPEDADEAEAYLRRAREADGGDPGTLRVRMRGSDGEFRCIDWHSVYDSEHDLLYAAGRDITEQEAMRVRLEQREVLLTRLVDEQLRTRDLEHARIAGDLHDHTMQHCIASLMYLDVGEVASARGQVQHALDSLRRVVQGLDVTEGSVGGLVSSLRDVAETVAGQFDLDVRTTLDVPRAVPDELAATAVRVAREGLVNAGKHSGGTTATLSVGCVADDALVIRVHDDGTPDAGEPRGAVPSGAGLGLPMLSERVRGLGGDLQLSQGADGTTLVVRLPLPAPAAAPIEEPT